MQMPLLVAEQDTGAEAGPTSRDAAAACCPEATNLRATSPSGAAGHYNETDDKIGAWVQTGLDQGSTGKLQWHFMDSAYKLRRLQRHDPIAMDIDILTILMHAKHMHGTPLALLGVFCLKARQLPFGQQGGTDLIVL